MKLTVRSVSRLACASVAWLLVASTSLYADETGEVVFSRDIRPILSKHCFKCHGPDDETRKGGLRLDVREAALQPADSGAVAIVPGKVDDSELLARIVADDPTVVMPPPETKSVLSPREKSLLSKWIAGGADYQPHWSFLPPKQSPLPPVKNAAWPKNEIDRFILARLEAEGMAPSPEADRHTLARRLYLDLLGLIPTIEETDAFVNDTAPDAYERLVDRLLKSPHYGERWRGSGWTWPVTPTPTATKRTERGRCGRIATGSSRRSTPTCRSTGSRSSNWRGTCFRTRRSRRAWRPVSTGTRCLTRRAESIRLSSASMRWWTAWGRPPRPGWG